MGWGFHGRIVGGTLGRLDVFEAGGAQGSRDPGRLEEDEVQARLDSPQLIDVSDFVPNVKCQGKEPTGLEYSLQFREHGLQFRGLEVNYRVEGDYAGEELVRERQFSHIALQEFDGGIQFPGQADHLVGNVESTDRNSPVVQEPSNVPWPTTKVQNLAGRQGLREPIEKRSIKRLGFELAINALGVFGGDEIVSRRR